ncbi:MAG: hypothetical protein ACXW0L_09840, partial [Methylosarcina sp.]
LKTRNAVSQPIADQFSIGDVFCFEILRGHDRSTRTDTKNLCFALHVCGNGTAGIGCVQIQVEVKVASNNRENGLSTLLSS